MLAAIFAVLTLSASGCDRETSAGVAPVTIAGKRYFLKIADQPDTRFKGLSGVNNIEADGGMVFAFPMAGIQEFVMRDCAVPIDIIYLDASGRVVATHAMVPEPPRGPNESDDAYNARLKRYSSRFPSQFVVELRGGSLPGLNLKEGDLVKLDTAALKKNCR